ncbi:MAG: glycosyltransferase, partial [Promethearchaeota archaeon]
KLGFVAKIFDYFSVGIPVVGNDVGGWSSIIKEEKVGLLSNNDPKMLADRIIQFVDNPDMSYEYGKRGIKLLKGKYSVKASTEKLINTIQQIL